MGQNVKELAVANIPPKEADAKKPIEEQKELLEKEIAEIRPEKEKENLSPKEKTVLPVEVAPLPEEIEEIKPKIRRKSKPKRKLKPKSQIPEMTRKWEEKWVNVDGKKVLFVPSGFEIMTKNGWRPIMTRADKIQK